MKKLFMVLLSVVVMLNVTAKNILNKAGLSASSPSYSLRLLGSIYTGAAIRICRSNGNATMDIGFSARNLDTTALKVNDNMLVSNGTGASNFTLTTRIFPNVLSTTNRQTIEQNQAAYYSTISNAAPDPSPTITGFDNLTRTFYDADFTLNMPVSNSTGAFTYTSSNTSVATISGNIVTIVGPGSTTITATQAADGTYATGTITATLTVNSVTVVTKNGQITSTNTGYVNKNGAIGVANGLDANGKIMITKSAGDGLTAATASTSAYAIKQNYPSSLNGYYWIQNPNINGGAPFQIYADMTTDGGGWTLIMCNASNAGWNYANAISLNPTLPSINSNYSIIGWADYIKKNVSGFQYMIDANTRNSNGGIWTANGAYTFLKGNNSQTDITLNTKFGTWTYNDGGIEQRMPWYSNCSGFITTSFDCGGGSWWGTLISNAGWTPAPWISSGCGTEGCMQNPGIIWYWVR
jgi:hypothetical protein